MQRPISGFNQKELDKLAKEQEKAHKKLSEAANPSKESPKKKTARGNIPGSKVIPKWAQSH